MQTYWRVQRWLKSSYLPTGFLVFGFSSRSFFLWASLLTVTSAKIHRPNTHGRWLPCGRAKRQCWPPCREKESESRARNKLGDDNTEKMCPWRSGEGNLFTRPSCIWGMGYASTICCRYRRASVARRRLWPCCEDVETKLAFFLFVCFFFHFWHLIHNCKEKETNKNKGP